MKQTTTDENVENKSILELIEQIAINTDDAGGFITVSSEPYTMELARRLGLTPMQAVMLAVIMDQCEDSHIRMCDIARHFSVRTISVMAKRDALDGLVEKGIILRRRNSEGDLSYRIPPESVTAISNGCMPEPEPIDSLSIFEFIEHIDQMLRKRANDEINDADLEVKFNELIDANQQLHLARTLKGFGLNYTNLMLFLVISMLFINNHDNNIMRGDIDDYFDRRSLRAHTQALEAGTHPLMAARLVEHVCTDGQVKTTAWCLTSHAKEDVFTELNFKAPVNVRANLMHHEDLTAKQLFYNPSVERQVNELSSLLEDERMSRVMKRLSDKGLRKGFTCLFYGAPGTGKTETVLQLARITGRDIMMVDVPAIRSKWVGETEKNIHNVFERYRKAVASGDHAPILLFNEADAILNKRNEGCVHSVDKMENAMQNIILQEMENLEGIMIATTNLTGSLDDAFERRFLYKIEFEKPMAAERCKIWKSMLPDLDDSQAQMLASKFEFSGGQIENIARKRIVSDILADRDTLDIDAVVESCKSETISKGSSASHIGF